MDDVERQKMKRLIKMLNSCRGSSTSMITLIIAPGTQLSQVNSMINDEKGKSSNVKCRVNRQSILSALESITQRLKLYSRCPENGLIIYCGENGDSSSTIALHKKITIDIVPPRAINTHNYNCGYEFDTSVLISTLSDDVVYGFIVIDGSGVLFARLDGNNKEILPNGFTVDLPKKHGCGGQSALRFSRLRVEKRHNYLTKARDEAVRCFITNDMPNVKGIILAGLADLKNELRELLDPRLQEKVVAVVDVAYGGSNGLNQAILLSLDKMKGIKLYEEIGVINTFFEHMQRDTGKYIYGLKSVHGKLKDSIIKTLILWDEFPAKHPDMPDVDYIDWLLDNYRDFGVELKLVTDKSSEGEQFIKGFSGIGAILHYPDTVVEEDDGDHPAGHNPDGHHDDLDDNDIGDIDLDDYM